MAASSDTQLDITTCSICFETFKVPKYLPCLHSFCRGCLQTYITSAFRNNSALTGIHCPVCRDFVKKPDSSNVEKWAAEFPCNHLLVSIIDMNHSREEYQPCQACKRKNKTEIAKLWCENCSEALCETCKDYHGIMKMLTSHKVIPINKMGTLKSPLQSADLYCREHPEGQLESYCSEHSAVCCISCVMLKHRKCENVGKVVDVANYKKSSEELKKLQKSFRDMKSDLQNLADSHIQNEQEFEKCLTSIKSEVGISINRILRHFESLREDMFQEINAAQKEMLPIISRDKDKLQCKLAAVDNDIRLLQTNIEHAAPAQFLQTLAILTEQNSTIEQFIENAKESFRNIKVSFKENENTKEIVRTIKKWGTLSIERQRIIDSNEVKLEGIHMMSAIPTLIKEVNTNHNHIQGIAILDDGRFITSRYRLQVVELWDDAYSIIASLSVPGEPYGIKMLNSTDGMVSIEDKALISFKVLNNVMIEMETINVPVSYDFTFYKGKYYIGSNKKIIVLDDSRKRERHITVNGQVGYITTRDDDTLWYTFYNEKTLNCIKLDGSPVFQYSHHKLQWTKGVTVDRFGNIYVCGSDSKNVHQLSHDGKLKRIILNNLPGNPYSIGFNKRNDKVVLVSHGHVLIYKLQ